MDPTANLEFGPLSFVDYACSMSAGFEYTWIL